MAENESFTPNWISPPGDTIASVIHDRNLAHEAFARSIGIMAAELDQLLRGQLGLTKDLASRLVAVLGSSVEFWLRREARYREGLARLSQEASRAVEQNWLDDVPAKEMCNLGWIQPGTNRVTQATSLLQFFGVPTVDAWRAAYSEALHPVAFRTSPTFQFQPGALAAWLRQGELLASSIQCGQWSPVRLQEAVDEIRDLTLEKDPKIFVPALSHIFARCGVAFVSLRTPKGCPASGVSRFLSHSRALLMLSVRYLVNDHFWFTLFHEMAHLLLHADRGFFLEGENRMSSKEEDEADQWAARTLIPPEFHAEMFRLPARAVPVIRFAHKVGIAPGIVVGQLQHRGYFRYDQLNKLKRRYSWSNGDASP